mgnify:CR=1 FL=1
MTAVKDDLIRNNNTINWVPESIGKGRFGDWLGEHPGLGYFQKQILGNSIKYLGMASADISILSEALKN